MGHESKPLQRRVETVNPARKGTQIAHECVHEVNEGGRSARDVCALGVRWPHAGLVSCAGASGGELMTHRGNAAFSAMRSNCKAYFLAIRQVAETWV